MTGKDENPLEAAYTMFAAGPAFPPDIPALKAAFMAGARAAVPTACEEPAPLRIGSGITLIRELDGSITFESRIDAHEYPRLDEFDQALLRNCERNDATIADRLLALEMLFRKMAQQRPPSAAV